MRVVPRTVFFPKRGLKELIYLGRLRVCVAYSLFTFKDYTKSLSFLSQRYWFGYCGCVFRVVGGYFQFREESFALLPLNGIFYKLVVVDLFEVEKWLRKTGPWAKVDVRSQKKFFMPKLRRKFFAEFKTLVALYVLSGAQTLSELPSKYGMHKIRFPSVNIG